MFRKLLTIVVLLVALISPSVSYAGINVVESGTLSLGEIQEEYTLFPVGNPADQLIPVSAVMEEVCQLQKNVPVLDRVDWSVYVVNQQITIPRFGLDDPLAGYSRHGPGSIAIFLFATPNTTEYTAHYIAAHEIGHLVRYKFISEDQLQEYVNMRSNSKERDGYYDSPEELFAEDFRWLFGSEESRYDYGYEPTYQKPGEKERQWILSKLSPRPELKPPFEKLFQTIRQILKGA